MDITAHALTKTYREQDGPVIGGAAGAGVDVSIPAGSFLALMGRSGSGKSTLLNLLAGIVRPDSGVVNYGDTGLWDLSDGRRSRLRATTTATVFQEYNLFDFLSVQENIALGIRMAGGHASRDRIAEALSRVGMQDYLRSRPDELSGGQRQRIAIARAVAVSPQVIFADEPTGTLDEANGRVVVALLRELAADGTSILMVTHDADVAAVTDRTLELRDGTIVNAMSAGDPA